MGLFGRKVPAGWPPTPYGYQPPADADVRSWACPDVLDCREGEHAPDRRTWPSACSKCGRSPLCSGEMVGRYEHAAERYKIDYLLAHATDWRKDAAQLDDAVWHYREEAGSGRSDGAAQARARVEAVLVQQDSVGSDYQARYSLSRAALRAGMLGEELAILQRWFEVVPRSNRHGGDRASVRMLIDATVEYLEHPQAPQDATYRQLWTHLRELWGQAQDYTTADNDMALRRLLQRLGNS